VRTEREVLSQVCAWAEANDRVRAAVLTSSRVDAESETDFLSDYDIEVYARDIEPFLEGDQWLEAFGSVVVRWPLRPRSTFDENWLTRLVLFDDGVRIDFQITAERTIAPDAYDDGYRVLIDKDGLTHGLQEPTFTQYLVKKPSAEEYETLVREFWWDATYVPKYLWRDELPFAAQMLAEPLRNEFLRTIIEWFIGVQCDWSVNTGVGGRWFKRYLDERTWSEYTSTFAVGEIEAHWDAFFNMVVLFRRLATSIGESLGYAYPHRLDGEMSDYYARIRATER
jgi:aminoglycoside 6-adenylyltransferase